MTGTDTPGQGQRTLQDRARTAVRRLGRPRPRDAVAGLVTGLFSIPEGMAYASIGGFNPVTGLYTGILPTLVGSLFARTVLMVTTLTSAIALSSRSAMSQAGVDPADPGNIAALTLLVGAIMLVMGLLRLGSVMAFVSHAVMTGFTTGIALQIVVGVLDDATGYKPQGHNKLLQLGNWVVHVGDWQGRATLVAIATVGVWLLARLVPRLKSLATLIALFAVSIVVYAAGIDVELVKGIASVPSSLPGATMPHWSAVPHLLLGAFAVALVALAQAAGIGAAVPNPDGSRADTSGDFTAQGLGNLAGGFFRSLPAGGSLSRTGVATEAGAVTRWTGVFAGAWLALVVVLCGSVAGYIPMPVIGGLVMVIGVELVVGRLGDIEEVLRTSRLSTVAMVVTFLATTQWPLQDAILLGVFLSLLLYCVQAAHRARLMQLTPVGDGRWRVGTPPKKLPSHAVTVLEYQGAELFAELPVIAQEMPDPTETRGAVLILHVRRSPDVPSTALITGLHHLLDTLAANGNRLIVAGVTPTSRRQLTDEGLAAELGDDGMEDASDILLDGLDRAYDRARTWISPQKDPA